MRSIIHTKDVALNPIRTRPSSQEKFSPRRLSRELPMQVLDASFEEYYFRDGSAGVPFLWESQPGTPRIKSREFPLPPLTPPPSYLYSTSKSRKPTKKLVKPNNFSPSVLLPKLNLKKSQMQNSPHKSSPSSRSYSVPSSPLETPNESRRRFSSPRISFDSRFGARMSKEEDDSDGFESPDSTLCFRGGRKSTNGRPRGCSPSIVKLLLREFAS